MTTSWSSTGKRDIPGVGIFDLLCIDADGKVVIVELKRDKTPREAVAQASALCRPGWTLPCEKEILDNTREYLGELLWTLRLREPVQEDANCRNSIFTIIASY